ncbi:primary-amine oxidase [Beijerinckia sp. L45]|uniref:primary-amine oxidase n=1 Tax=Beijerinckia sp. L45 TaxID=1641855 RepID=UPI001FF077AD|nr:primary-amine oxidase [Beijerinckia sp. L45]
MTVEALRQTERPLDPLRPDEIETAARIVRAAHDLGPGMRFETIVLHESMDGVADRRAFVAVYDSATVAVFEAIVSLAEGRVLSWTARLGARPRIAPEEFLAAEHLARLDPRFIAALARRGITDMALVCCDPWSCGVFGASDEDGRRIIQVFTWIRLSTHDNQFAHPVEGLTALVDLNSSEVIRVDDDPDAPPVPMTPSNYSATFQETWRTDMKPIDVVQPDGASFSVDGWAVTWCGWQFSIGFTPREGLVLHNLTIRDGDIQRSVLRRAALAEMVVPYGSPHAAHVRKNAFDCGEYGIGVLANSLQLGCDCLGVIRYFDAAVNGIDGSAQVIRNAICMHEEDTGIQWKHTDFRTGEVSVRRGRRLVISFIATVGNYEYAFYWHLQLDGTIELEVKLTGIINTTGLLPDGTAGRGTLVAPGVVGHYHQHIFNVRLDMAVDGPDNTVLEIDTVADAPGPDNPWNNALTLVETPLGTEMAGRRHADAARLRSWTIVNRFRRTALGHHPAYKLVPHSAVQTFARPGSQVGTRAGFAGHDLWVTQTRADERWPAGDYVNQSGPGEGLPAYAAQDRPITDRAITVWHTFGHHHVPRPEDYPVQPVVSCGFTLQPFGFFDRNPTLDVPPSNKRHSCCG